MTSAAVQVWVSGKVQGVFYRQSTMEKAQSLGVHGWVKNLEDGRVAALLVGDSEALEAILKWMESGPPNAVVSQLEIVVEENPEAVTGFEVRY